MAQFFFAGLLALGMLGTVATVAVHRIGTNQALHEARDLAEMQAQLLQPDVTDALLNGDPAAIATFDSHVRVRVLSGRVRRIKVWSADGRVVYADAPTLIGQRFTLGRAELSTLSTGRPTSDLSPLTAAENQLERGRDARLLEVYERVQTASGQPLLFESYVRYDSVMASGRRLWTAFAPALLLALVALWLLQLPLAWRLTGRLHASQRDRDALHRRALEASEHERRMIAGDLHDGVVQTLVGVSFSLAAVRGDVAAACSPQVAGVVDEAVRTTRRGIGELRTLLVDIYPSSLKESGLVAALTDLVATLPSRGVIPRLQFPDRLDLDDEVEELFYRVAQEAVRNVLAHARAAGLTIAVQVRCGATVLEVRDDGQGFAESTDSSRPHFGLRMLNEMAHRHGGRLDIHSVPGAGTTVRLEVPVS